MKDFFCVALFATTSVFSQNLPVDLSFDQGAGFSSSSIISTFSEFSNNKIFIGGNFTSYNNLPVDNMLVLNENGSIDNSFICNDCINSTVSASVLIDDDVLIGGGFTTFNGVTRRFIARVNQDGSLDDTFNADDVFSSQITNNDITKLEFYNNKIYVSGAFYDSTLQPVLAPFLKFNSDGSLDSSFHFDESISNNTILSFVIQPDGKIIIISRTDGVLRLNVDGSIDNTFVSPTMYFFKPKTLCLQPSGKLLLGGRFTLMEDFVQSSYMLIRLNSDGTFDDSFNLIEHNIVDSSEVTCIINFGSNYLVGGRFNNFNGYSDFVGINSNGYFNPNFKILGGLTSYPNVDDTASLSQIFKLGSGKVLVSGEFGKIGNIALRNLARLSSQELGVENFGNSRVLSIYYSDVSCNFLTNNELISSVEIFDLSGKLIDSCSVNSQEYSYPLQNNAILLYRLTMSDGKIYTGKMID